MEEQTSWRGHGFTLFVFVGIAFLCGIFFILGMLVGRSQGQKFAAGGAQAKKGAPSAVKPGSDLDFSEDLQKNELPPLVVEQPSRPEPPPESPATVEPGSDAVDPQPPAAPPPHAASNPSVVNLQLEAFGQSAPASKMVAELKKLGFSNAKVVPPATGSPYYKVQVGPYTDTVEADAVKKKLEANGYHTIKK